MLGNKFKKLRTYLLFCITAIILASTLTIFRNPASDIARFPLKIFTWFKQEIGAVIFYHRNFRENQRLKKEFASLKQKINAAEEFNIENQRLRNLLSFKENTPLSLVAAQVIGRDPSNWSSVIIIDKGKKDGIRPSMAVITREGLVGSVVEAGNSTSRIMLINDPNVAVASMIQRSREQGLVSGTLENLLVMRYLSSAADIEVEDLVITSSLSRKFPKGIIVGKVKEVGEQLLGLSLFAIIQPAVNFYLLEEVLVVVNGE